VGNVPSAPAGAPDPSVFTSAVARYRALERLRAFRESLYECLDARADALFELADAVLCADHAVTSLVQLCLEPEFTRGHGALYDALSAGRIDDEKLLCLLSEELPGTVDGPEARAWIAEHDVYGLRISTSGERNCSRIGGRAGCRMYVQPRPANAARYAARIRESLARASSNPVCTVTDGPCRGLPDP
jgi:hypothetical protein